MVHLFLTFDAITEFSFVIILLWCSCILWTRLLDDSLERRLFLFQDASLISCQGQSDDIINNKERKTDAIIQLESARVVNSQVLDKSPWTSSCKNRLNYSTSFNSKFKKAKCTTCKRKAKSTLPCKKFKGEKLAKLSSFAECCENSTPLEQSSGENFTNCVLTKHTSNPVAGDYPSVESMSPVSVKVSAILFPLVTFLDRRHTNQKGPICHHKSVGMGYIKYNAHRVIFCSLLTSSD